MAPLRPGILGPDRRVDWVPLRTLVVLRWIAIAGQLAAIFVAGQLFELRLPIGPAVLVVGMLVLANVHAIFVHPETKRLSECEAARHLIFDVAELTALLALTGGLHNPFALLMLVPVTVSATALGRRTTAMIGAAAIAGVAFIAFVHLPLESRTGVMRMPDPFVAGFLVAIVVGILFIAAYVRRVATEVAAMSDALAATQMALAREQKLTDLSGIVAAAAHELGTPLATIKLASSELLAEMGDQGQATEDLRLIASQADRCRDILRSMGAEALDDPHLAHAPIAALVREAAEPHENRGCNINWDVAADEGAAPDPPVVVRSPEILHGLRNLIQNAVGFAREDVWIDIRWNDENVTVRIADDGPGFPPDVLGRIGEPFVHGRGETEPPGRQGYTGMGLGLFIAITLLERSGAELAFANARPSRHARPERRGGAVVEVIWPRDRISPRAPG